MHELWDVCSEEKLSLMNWKNSLQLKKITFALHDTKHSEMPSSCRSAVILLPRGEALECISDNVKSTTQLTCLRSDLSNYFFPIKNRIGNSKYYFIHYFYFVIIIFMNYCYWVLFLTIFLPYCPVTEKLFEGVVIKVCVYVTIINKLIYSRAPRSRARAKPITKKIW